MGSSCRTSAAFRRGLSLIEVLATLVLVGIVLPAAMKGVTLSLRAASLARHQQEASQLAEMRLNEVLALEDSSVLAGSGSFAPDWPEYSWQAQTYTADFGLTEVEVRVTWLERGIERSVTLSTIVYDMPTIEEEPAEEASE
jgi:prepilin-type N-terminal cleavage/methylation domain-containing protein